jgi:hypothetical protein
MRAVPPADATTRQTPWYATNFMLVHSRPQIATALRCATIAWELILVLWVIHGFFSLSQDIFLLFFILVNIVERQLGSGRDVLVREEGQIVHPEVVLVV